MALVDDVDDACKICTGSQFAQHVQRETTPRILAVVSCVPVWSQRSQRTKNTVTSTVMGVSTPSARERTCALDADGSVVRALPLLGLQDALILPGHADPSSP